MFTQGGHWPLQAFFHAGRQAGEKQQLAQTRFVLAALAFIFFQKEICEAFPNYYDCVPLQMGAKVILL